MSPSAATRQLQQIPLTLSLFIFQNILGQVYQSAIPGKPFKIYLKCSLLHFLCLGDVKCPVQELSIACQWLSLWSESLICCIFNSYFIQRKRDLSQQLQLCFMQKKELRNLTELLSEAVNKLNNLSNLTQKISVLDCGQERQFYKRHRKAEHCSFPSKSL